MTPFRSASLCAHSGLWKRTTAVWGCYRCKCTLSFIPFTGTFKPKLQYMHLFKKKFLWRWNWCLFFPSIFYLNNECNQCICRGKQIKQQAKLQPNFMCCFHSVVEAHRCLCGSMCEREFKKQFFQSSLLHKDLSISYSPRWCVIHTTAML